MYVTTSYSPTAFVCGRLYYYRLLIYISQDYIIIDVAIVSTPTSMLHWSINDNSNCCTSDHELNLLTIIVSPSSFPACLTTLVSRKVLLMHHKIYLVCYSVILPWWVIISKVWNHFISMLCVSTGCSKFCCNTYFELCIRQSLLLVNAFNLVYNICMSNG